MTRIKHQGFTLIELMVVLVVIGIASAAISLSIKPDPLRLRLLRMDAQRLSQLLQVAQAEARADGRAITWETDAKGFRFRRTTEDGLGVEYFNHDEQLRPRPWKSKTIKVRIEPQQILILNAEWINPPFQLVLSGGQYSLSLQRDADGLLRVVNHR